MKNLYDRLMEDITLKAKENNVRRSEVLRVFLSAYEEHKQHHGSFAQHPEYNDAMKGRYLFMHDKAIKYIQSKR